MREISNHFAIIPEDLIRESLMMGESVGIPAGSEEFSCTRPVTFSQSPSESSDGVSYEMSFRAVTTDRSVLSYNQSRAYLALILTDGAVQIIGDVSGAPLIIVTPYQNSIVVEASFKAAEPLPL